MKLTLTTDASDVAIGAVLAQENGGPLGFFSRKLSTAQKKYSTFDKELLGIKEFIQHFRHMVEGGKFTVFTDHKPLTLVMPTTTAQMPRQERHLFYISKFTTDIRHVKGEQNLVADHLSRPFMAALLPGVDLETMAHSQTRDPEIRAARTAITSLDLQDIKLNYVTLLCDVSGGVPRPLVPSQHQREVFNAIHGLAHLGPVPTTRAVSDRFVWHNLKKDVRTWCRECLGCQASKVGRHVKTPLEKFPLPERRLGHLHVDLVGPLPQSEGHAHIFTMADRWSRWPEAVPVADITATSCVNALIGGWVSRFGVPTNLTSDRGGTVHVLPLGRDGQVVGSQEHQHHRVPPAVQRVGGEVSPHPQGLPYGDEKTVGMDGAFPMCSSESEQHRGQMWGSRRPSASTRQT